MPRRSTLALAPRLALCALATGAGAASCLYDWSTGAASGDASVDDAGDAARDASSTDGSAGDAAAMDGGDAGAGDSMPASDASPPSCATLAQQLATARTNAKACVSSPSACQNAINDQCNCPSVVGRDLSSPETVSYKQAIDAFVDAGCVAGCPMMCGSAQRGLCVAGGPDGGLACSQ